MKVAVIGAGSWGTTLANLLAGKGEQVSLWAWESEVADQINKEHVNEAFLPVVRLDPALAATNDIEECVRNASVVLTVCPSHTLREVLNSAAARIELGATVVNASKGIETGTLERMSEVVAEVVPPEKRVRYVVLSGPSFASEVARRRPTVITAASADERAAGFVQQLFSTGYLRVYKHDDVVGVELGGALKNVIAIA
ncbi:MAG TPA: NAD(P)-binding domain-containing protein, partial [Candidatus Glassbacteria bacterium]|nr:NAD(P)-binding domain-containing protein [Candidatus Glassbacteria bacterium]